jgi:hypothetical protein
MEYRDNIEAYGSIIKDLTDTEKLLEKFRLEVLGYELQLDGKAKRVRDINIDEDAMYDFINIVKSVVNQNTHFSRYEDGTVQNSLKAANYYINRHLMMQGSKIPLRYRAKISYEAMNLIQASLYKAHKGNILIWTKGTFGEQSSYQNTNEKKGGLTWLLPWKKQRR